MKVTDQGRVRPVVGVGYYLQQPGPSGQVPTANGSNGVAWGSNVAIITADGSNSIRGPFVNFASGSNILFTFDGAVGSVPSNTIRIHSTGGGGGGGISGITVEDEGTPLSTLADTLNFVGSGVTASGTGTEKTITISGGGGGTIAYPSLKPGTPDFDFDTGAMSGWTMQSEAGSVVIAQAFDRALDGSHLRFGLTSSQRGLLLRTGQSNSDFDVIVGDLWMDQPYSNDSMPGFALLNSSGTGVGIVQYNDGNAYLANITTYDYTSALQTLTGYGHNFATNTVGPARLYYRLQRVGNDWTASVSVTGDAWNTVSSSSSVTITVDRFALGQFLNGSNRAGIIWCDFVDGIS